MVGNAIADPSRTQDKLLPTHSLQPTPRDALANQGCLLVRSEPLSLFVQRDQTIPFPPLCHQAEWCV